MLSFFAGIEPTSNASLKALYFLSENKKVQDKLYKEIVKEFNDEITYEKLSRAPYLDAVFNETIRIGNTFLHLFRTCNKVNDFHSNKSFVTKHTMINLI